MGKTATILAVVACFGTAMASGADDAPGQPKLEWGLSPAEVGDLYKLPMMVFLTQRHCEHCGQALPKQCVVFGLAHSPTESLFVVTVLDHASEPQWTVVEGQRVPDARWVDHDQPISVKALVSRIKWPRNWSLEGWLQKERAAESAKKLEPEQEAAAVEGS